MRTALSLAALALLLAASACGRKDIGELCREADECESEDCTVLGYPGADGKKQCSGPCGGGCPAGAVCIAGTDCARACKADSDCPDGTACHATFGACFAACESDDQCGTDMCPMPGGLCE